MKIWELHSRQVGGAIQTTPGGLADVCGLAITERAYVFALKDYQPAEMVELVRMFGPAAAARRLINHFSQEYPRGLVFEAAGCDGPTLLRGDEGQEELEANEDDPTVA